uniref:Disease resistance protein At4g27190-like leucine-rich repeats domain-containing protein n=1 Tax=Cajanus cajan TaxID=3821 RepID=A0A151UCP5_CAJCA|nr:hypothetical protein KK1_021254 [Cajanus cajan]
MRKMSIYKCHKLQYLFTSAVAKMLMNLEEITVEECELVKEIVAKEGDATSTTIKFERLNTIALYSLPSLICFYSGSDTLQLPSLTTVRIGECRNMKIFSYGVIYTRLFRGIQMLSDDPKQDLLFHQDLNGTIKVILQRQVRTSFH